jgi:hypothetical protein
MCGVTAKTILTGVEPTLYFEWILSKHDADATWRCGYYIAYDT